MSPPGVESFEEFASFAIPRLRRVAFAYCQDWHHADDAVQGALERVFAAWSRVRPGDAYGYTRTTLIRLLVSEGRRAWRRHEVTTDDVALHEPTRRHGDDDGDPAHGEQELFAVLAGLSDGQRAVVVLRYVENLSVAETAGVLGCGEGNVKSQAHAARRRLRALLGDPSTRGAQR
ncbi:RNA polymerase sigma factor, sigma-70 family [Quadrisphaera granulorum]|uniref:RNA polymerase sigma factor (Sigma-70 family) n=1 Tax=Quadrisphaera granulorum TaxID=317664 RepID=A0A316AB64_9ACTN|nr:sigma-70 family RNA polymerase sigma factor [Quadrisphaera granulorum]PWJ54953.1 RNA polymerase sigma factor (sigma-70 family) [Quadrisphaera granulorum]SZE95899.1 RNA polymerase sigma factor, sigma-70 family [Quadrisphaera granulorum]